MALIVYSVRPARPKRGRFTPHPAHGLRRRESFVAPSCNVASFVAPIVVAAQTTDVTMWGTDATMWGLEYIADDVVACTRSTGTVRWTEYTVQGVSLSGLIITLRS